MYANAFFQGEFSYDEAFTSITLNGVELMGAAQQGWLTDFNSRQWATILDDWPDGRGNFIAGTNTLVVTLSNTAGPGGFYLTGQVASDAGMFNHCAGFADNCYSCSSAPTFNSGGTPINHCGWCMYRNGGSCLPTDGLTGDVRGTPCSNATVRVGSGASAIDYTFESWYPPRATNPRLTCTVPPPPALPPSPPTPPPPRPHPACPSTP